MTIQYQAAPPSGTERPAERWLPAEPGTYEHLRPAAARVVTEPGPAGTSILDGIEARHAAVAERAVFAGLDERVSRLETLITWTMLAEHRRSEAERDRSEMERRAS